MIKPLMSLALALSLPHMQVLAADCVPMREHIPLPDEVGYGYFLRYHPSGNYVFHSGTGNIGENAILDLTEKNPDGSRKVKVIYTPMENEIHPTPDWKFLSSTADFSTQGDTTLHGMHYYRFADLVAFGTRAQPAFTDKSHSSDYQSHAALPGSNDSTYKFTTVIYNSLETREIVVTNPDNPVAQTVNLDAPIYNLCTGQKTESMLGIRKRLNELAERYYTVNLESEEREKLIEEFKRLEQQAAERARPGEVFELLFNGDSFTQPRISPDGKLLTGNLDGNLRIFSVDSETNNCTELPSPGETASKAGISYDSSNKKVTYTVNDYILDPATLEIVEVPLAYMFNPSTGESVLLSDIETEGIAEYPDFLRDGRIIYLTGEPYTESEKLVIVDPNQIINGKGHPSCIKAQTPPASAPPTPSAGE